jgi:hypothetical protein
MEADRFVRRYAVTTTNSLRFWLSIDHVKVGLSFRQAAAVITQHRNRTKNIKLMGISDHMVEQYVRVLLGVAFQLVSNVCSAIPPCGLFLWREMRQRIKGRLCWISAFACVSMAC